MANWYLSSVTFAAIPLFTVTTAYLVGDFVRRRTGETAANRHVWRCTTAGTTAGAEPTYTNADNDGQTFTSGTATFTCVTGRAAHGWSAAAGDIRTLDGSGAGTLRLAAADQIFASSDHSDPIPNSTATPSPFLTFAGAIAVISVNRAGSVPPVPADHLAGATFTCTGSDFIDPNVFYQGCRWTAVTNLFVGDSGAGHTQTLTIVDGLLTPPSNLNTINELRLILDNTQITFSATTKFIGATGTGGNIVIDWRNTVVPFVGPFYPTILFGGTSAITAFFVTCRGLDLSALTSATALTNPNAIVAQRFLFDSCKIDPTVLRLSTAGNRVGDFLVELVNCYDGTNVINERYTQQGQVTTERTVTLSGGANDGSPFSHKMVSSADIFKRNSQMDGFVMEVYNGTTGVSQTATVEVMHSGPTLMDDELSLDLEYYPTSGSTLADFSTTLSHLLAVPAAVASSTAAWDYDPVTPVRQKLVATFTAQRAGRLRGIVKLGKASTTVYYNPKMTVT